MHLSYYYGGSMLQLQLLKCGGYGLWPVCLVSLIFIMSGVGYLSYGDNASLSNSIYCGVQ